MAKFRNGLHDSNVLIRISPSAIAVLCRSDKWDRIVGCWVVQAIFLNINHDDGNKEGRCSSRVSGTDNPNPACRPLYVGVVEDAFLRVSKLNSRSVVARSAISLVGTSNHLSLPLSPVRRDSQNISAVVSRGWDQAFDVVPGVSAKVNFLKAVAPHTPLVFEVPSSVLPHPHSLPRWHPPAQFLPFLALLGVRSDIQRYLGHDGEACPQDGKADAGRAGRGARARDGLLLRLPDDQGHQGELQAHGGGRRLRWRDDGRQEEILIWTT